jgi:hypothetical protein
MNRKILIVVLIIVIVALTVILKPKTEILTRVEQTTATSNAGTSKIKVDASFESVREVFKNVNTIEGKTITVTGVLGYPDLCADGENLESYYEKHFCKGNIVLEDANRNAPTEESIRMLDKSGMPYTHASRGTCDATCNEFPYSGKKFTVTGVLHKEYPENFQDDEVMAYWTLTTITIIPLQ